MRWLWLFYRHANADHVKRSEGLLRDIGLESRRLHQELAESEGFELVQRGLLMLCQSEEGLEEEAEVAQAAQRLGLKATVFAQDRLKEFEPDCSVDALGGVWFEQDCHLNPMDFVAALRKGITNRGGVFFEEDVVEFVREKDQVVGVRTSKGHEHVADRIILAGGVISSELARKLDLRLPMQGGKGYSLTLKEPRKALRLCSLLKEGRVAVTPMGDMLRVSGTMEICGTDTSLSPPRLQGIIESFCRFYPDFGPDDFSGIDPWVGLRPCSPDGLPYIGPLSRQKRVIVATGHSMMGLSLAPVTGMLCEKLITGESSPINLSALSPERFH
jgi:D-amino-acid dehydrogenase